MITIMDYDLPSNPSIGAGPSSPLNDSCAPMGARFGSAVSGVDAWTAAGMPSNQILLGLPAYGHSYVVPPTQISSQNVLQLSYPPFNLSLEEVGDSWSGDGGVDVCGNLEGPGGTYTYWGLMQQGFLNADGSVKDGIEYRFDGCSMTVCAFPKSITQNLNLAVLFSRIFTTRARTFTFPMKILFRSLLRVASLIHLAWKDFQCGKQVETSKMLYLTPYVSALFHALRNVSN